jgi:hypothetical protein
MRKASQFYFHDSVNQLTTTYILAKLFPDDSIY